MSPYNYYVDRANMDNGDMEVNFKGEQILQHFKPITSFSTL